MDIPTQNICSLLSRREVRGVIRTNEVSKMYLIRKNVDKLESERTTRWPVETWRCGNVFICVLYDFYDNEEFLEDLFFCGYSIEAVLHDYLYCNPISYV